MSIPAWVPFSQSFVSKNTVADATGSYCHSFDKDIREDLPRLSEYKSDRGIS